MSPVSPGTRRRSPSRERRWVPSPLSGRRGLLPLVGVGLAVALVGGGTVAVGRETGTFGTRLVVAAPLGDSLTYDAYTGSTYNSGLTLDVEGPGEVRVVSARALDVSDGLRQLPAVLGWGCAPAEGFASVVGDDPRRLPKADIRPMGTPLRASDGSCWYVLLRFDPTRKGTLRASRIEIVYRVGWRTVRDIVHFTTEYEVKHDGRDAKRERT